MIVVAAEQYNTPLLQAIAQFMQIDERFHFPGHGGVLSDDLFCLLGENTFRADLTELPGLDDLNNPHGVIQKAQELAAKAFGVKHTFFLVNGSTIGLQTLVLAYCAPGDKILLPRNLHRSLLGGLILSGAQPVFLKPDIVPDFQFPAGVSPKTVAQGVAFCPEAKAMMIIHPNYYGVYGKTAWQVRIAAVSYTHLDVYKRQR